MSRRGSEVWRFDGDPAPLARNDILLWTHQMHLDNYSVSLDQSGAYTFDNASHPNTFMNLLPCTYQMQCLFGIPCAYWYLLHVGNFDNLSKGRAMSWILKITISISFTSGDIS